MHRNVKLALAIGGAAVVLAAGSTVAMAAASGAFTATRPVAYSPAAARTGPPGPAPAPSSSSAKSGPLASAGSAACAVASLPGVVVDATLTDAAARMGYPSANGYGYGPMMGRGGMMGGAGWWPAGMMSVRLSPTSVPAGAVSLRVSNTGAFTHELVVLPLTGGTRPGQRAVGSDGTVSETGSLGEASNDCGAGEGDGIKPGDAGWVSLHLAAGRYELMCNLPGHYAAGMYAELDVTN